MPKVDLSAFTVEELEDLRSAIDEEKVRRREEERERLVTELRAAATRYGMSMNQFLKTSERKRRVAPTPKYHNPDNPKQVWSGRGKQPAWVQKALTNGMQMSDLEQVSTVPTSS